VEDTGLKNVKDELVNLRRNGLHYEKHKQKKLQSQLRNLIVEDEIIKPAIDEAKLFSQQFKETFGNELALFFSGSKGCHAYTFFEPSKFINLDMALTWFVEDHKQDYPTLDLSVAKDATNRISRVPYSKHQLTGLTVVPFSIEESYSKIMRKSLNPNLESFNRDDFTSNFNNYLQKIDKILDKKRRIAKYSEKKKNKNLDLRKPFKNKITDHRTFFKELIGEPEREYPDKEYVMYKCPFTDHEDNKPSFRVHRTGYYCYGCGKKGNYWQFLKDYNNWDDQQVKAYLRSRNIKN
jgi:hypothetical protein